MSTHNDTVQFRWNGQALIVTTPTTQHEVSAEETLKLLSHLYDHRNEIIAALQDDDALPDWARKDAALLAQQQRRVIPSLLAPVHPAFLLPGRHDGDETNSEEDARQE